MNKKNNLRNILTFAEYSYICGFHYKILLILITIAETTNILQCKIRSQLSNPEYLATIDCCIIRDKTNESTIFLLQLFVRAYYGNF